MISDSAQARREALWVEIAPAARRIVERSAARVDVDDVLQDVAERFFRHAPDFPSTDEGLAWVSVVARRRLIDLSRRSRPIPTAEIPSRHAVDAERSALGQLALECARRFMREHGIRENWLTGGEDGPATAKDRMSRSRARRRLADHVGRKVGWPVLIPRLRWLAPALGVTAMIPLPYLWFAAPDGHPESSIPSRVGPATERREPAQVLRSPEVTDSSHVLSDGQGVGTTPVKPLPRNSEVVAEAPLPWGGARLVGHPEGAGHPEDRKSVVCVWGLQVAPDTCVAHPLP